MIASGEVDVISLLTPPAVRHDVIFPAIEKGIHLLVEKPFGETLCDAVSFVEAAEKAGVTLAVNHQLGFMEDVVAMRDIVNSGEIGDIRYISHDELKNRTRVRGWRSREQRLEISIFSIHLIDRIRTLASSPPQSVSAVTRHWNPDVKGETFTSLTVQFENGVVGTMVSNWHGLTLSECRLRVDATKGSVLSVKKVVLADTATLHIHPLNGKKETREFHREGAFTHAMGESMNHLMDSARRGAEPMHSGRGNLYTMQNCRCGLSIGTTRRTNGRSGGNTAKSINGETKMTTDCPTTPEDIAQYQKKGFISYPNFFNPEDLRELADALDYAVAINRARIKGAEKRGPRQTRIRTRI